MILLRSVQTLLVFLFSPVVEHLSTEFLDLFYRQSFRLVGSATFGHGFVHHVGDAL